MGRWEDRRGEGDGFEAYGIEIESKLSELSIQLAADHNISVEILCTSYLPEGYEECEGFGGKDLLLPKSTISHGESIDTTPIYEGLDPSSEVDLFFVCPCVLRRHLLSLILCFDNL